MNARVGFSVHVVAYVSTLLLLVVATRSVRVTLIAGAAWGVAIAVHYFVARLAPRLRQRWIAEELGRSAPPRVEADRKERSERKVRSLEELSASIAHEIRNPVAAAKSLVQQMGEDPTADHNVGFAEGALGELDRVERSIRHLLKYARDEALRLETLDLADVVGAAFETFRERIERSGVEADCDLAAAGFVRADADKLRRVVLNLIGNALDALEGSSGSAVLSVAAGENLAGTEAWVRVRDNGPGIDPAIREKLFDPFYSTKESGTGLGLALSKKLVEAHGGTLEVESWPGEGSEFTVVFPRNAEPAGARS